MFYIENPFISTVYLLYINYIYEMQGASCSSRHSCFGSKLAGTISHLLICWNRYRLDIHLDQNVRLIMGNGVPSRALRGTRR